MMYNWVFRLCPSPGIPETRKHNLSETESHSTISRTACPGFRPQSGPVTKFSSHSCMFVILWLPLWREDGSVIYCCCLVSPAQSLSGLSPAGQMTISCCPHIWNSRNLEGQVPVFISPGNRVTQLYPRALGSRSVASYDSQGYGGVLTRLHTGYIGQPDESESLYGWQSVTRLIWMYKHLRPRYVEMR
jgi:hypothetical protein